jgi:Cu/Zn superoxide dismutase
MGGSTGGSTTGGVAGGGKAGGGGTAAGSGGVPSGGTAGTSSAGKSGGGGAAGGTATGGSGGAGGGGGSGKTAVASLMPTSGNQLTGTATFTQSGQMVTLVISVSNCPPGNHASHIHANKSCGNNGMDAGDHWVPQGEVLPEVVCASDGKGTATVTPPAGTWTIGSGNADVTAHALIIHTGANSNPGGRIACGVINAQ